MSRSHGVRLTWLGHATFQIISPQEKVILIDPSMLDLRYDPVV